MCVAPIVENKGLALPPPWGRPVVGFGVENHTPLALVGLRIHNTTSMYIQPHRGPLHGTMEHSTCFNTDLPTTMRPDNAYNNGIFQLETTTWCKQIPPVYGHIL